MDVLKLLKQDHDKVKKLLVELNATTERGAKTRTELFARIKRELTIHEIVEEEIVYPAFREQGKLKEIVLEGYEEHHVVDKIVGEISSVPVDDETWGAKASVMKENVEHHIEEEEGEMFKTARRLFDAEELEALGSRVEARKREIQDASPEELERTRDAA